MKDVGINTNPLRAWEPELPNLETWSPIPRLSRLIGGYLHSYQQLLSKLGLWGASVSSDALDSGTPHHRKNGWLPKWTRYNSSMNFYLCTPLMRNDGASPYWLGEAFLTILTPHFLIIF
jgi:hypothetical protein